MKNICWHSGVTGERQGILRSLSMSSVLVALILGCSQLAPEPTPSKSDPAAYAEHLVWEAIAMYEEEGLQQTLAHYKSPESRDGPWYVFIASTETGRNVAHFHPDIVGRDLNTVSDSAGYCFGCAFLDATAMGIVVSYLHTNPETRIEGPKHSFVARRDSYIFGSGWYEDVPRP